jgi:uncharacterized membrane protein
MTVDEVALPGERGAEAGHIDDGGAFSVAAFSNQTGSNFNQSLKRTIQDHVVGGAKRRSWSKRGCLARRMVIALKARRDGKLSAVIAA